jgi:hypothetical protein
MQPRNFLCDLPIPFIDRMMSSMSSSMSLGQLFASFRFARDQTPSDLGGQAAVLPARKRAQLAQHLSLA